MPKGQVCPEFLISAIRISSDRVTRNPLTGWSPEMDHRKSESSLSEWYSESREFQFTLVLRFWFRFSCCSVQTDFSSVVDARNSVTSELFVR
jgi:hypothetical protein